MSAIQSHTSYSPARDGIGVRVVSLAAGQTSEVSNTERF